MIRARRFTLLALAGLVACEQAALDPGFETSLALDVWMEPGLASLADAGTVHIEGPTNRTVSIQPGETQTVENLAPGSYTVALEAFLGGQLESFGQTSVTVVAGQTATANIQLRSFVPGNVTAPPEALAGQPIEVDFDEVEGATAYRVEWDDDPEFPSPQSTQVGGSPAPITIEEEGAFHVRVRARNRFGSISLPGTASEVLVSPPLVPLVDGVPRTGRSGGTGSQFFYAIDVPAGGSSRVLQVLTLGGSGNADLFVKLGADPSLTDFTCASDLDENVELCSIFDPEPGTWHVMLHGSQAYANLTIAASILEVRTLEHGTPITDLSGSVDEFQYFEFVVPEGAPAGHRSARAPNRRIVSASDLLGGSKPLPARDGPAPAAFSPGGAPVAGTLRIATSGGTGDVDLLGHPGSPLFSLADLPGFACFSFQPGNDDFCEIENPESGAWTIVLLGFEDYSGVTLRGEFETEGHLLGITGSGDGRVTGGPIDCTFSDGSGSGTCSATVPENTDVTLTATPDPGFQFDGWSGAGCSGTGTCVVSMTEERVVHADFSAVPVAPEISEADVTTVEVQSPVCTSQTLVVIRFDYFDPNGDVPDPVIVRTAFSFQPGGPSGTITPQGERNGDGVSGFVEIGYCVQYGEATELTFILSIADLATLRSNELTVVLPRPDGSAAPPAGRGGASGAALRGSGGD